MGENKIEEKRAAALKRLRRYADAKQDLPSAIYYARVAGLTETQIHEASGLARTTIDRHMASKGGGSSILETDATRDQAENITDIRSGWNRTGRLGIELVSDHDTVIRAALALQAAGCETYVTWRP